MGYSGTVISGYTTPWSGAAAYMLAAYLVVCIHIIRSLDVNQKLQPGQEQWGKTG